MEGVALHPVGGRVEEVVRGVADERIRQRRRKAVFAGGEVVRAGVRQLVDAAWYALWLSQNRSAVSSGTPAGSVSDAKTPGRYARSPAGGCMSVAAGMKVAPRYERNWETSSCVLL
jgi:hypothetical protein